MSFKILIIDDEIDDRGSEISELPELLRKAGYAVKATSDGNRAYDLFWQYRPHLVVLDIMFGDEALGVEICRSIRQSKDDTPIILVTRYRKETQEILDGFKAGADDYVILPCDNREITARIRANLPPEAVIVDDYVYIDFVGYRLWVQREGGWQEVHLSRLLWQLLEVLVLNAGIIVPTTRIKDRVYGKPVGDSALAVAIFKLRQKLEPDPGCPVYIEAIRGIGYRFNGTLVRANAAPPAESVHMHPEDRQAYPPDCRQTGSTKVLHNAGLKARLMAHAEAAIDNMLDGKRRGGDLPPAEMERLVRAAGQYVMERFTAELGGSAK
jgi:two-component system alkaline phosphatase synthesis response regulator PhoP